MLYLRTYCEVIVINELEVGYYLVFVWWLFDSKEQLDKMGNRFTILSCYRFFMLNLLRLLMITALFACSSTPAHNYTVVPEITSEHIDDSSIISWNEFKLLAKRSDFEGTYLFAEGIYQIAEPIYIKGEDKVVLVANKYSVFKGDYQGEGGSLSDGFVLTRGNIELYNFSFQNMSYCLRVNKNTVVNDVVIDNLSANNVHSCIVIDRYNNLVANDWDIKNTTIENYYRVALRIAGTNTSNINVDNFYFDGLRENNLESYCYKGGVQIYESAHDLTFTSGVIKNNVGGCGDKYPQGDGIEIDNVQGMPFNINLNNITISNSRDGNVDIKADNVYMSNVTSVSSGNTTYAYKLWSYDNYVCDKCQASGEFFSLINLHSAEATFTDFYNDQSISFEAPFSQDLYFPKTTTVNKVPLLLINN